jgi:NTE family protein
VPSLREWTALGTRARRKPRTAFVLSGGGNLGAIQVGMLRALVEHGVVPDVVVGCSVGALNGGAFALSPDHQGVDRLVEHWRSVGQYQLMPTSRIPPALQLVRKGVSLHDNDGLRASLESLVGRDRRFEDLRIPFECVAVDVDRAVEKWFTEGPIIPAVLASAALPGVYPPVELDGRRYADGGIVNNVPITRAVELGCREIYVLHVGPHGRPDHELKRPLDGLVLAYWVARNSRFARDLADLPDGVEAVILPPGQRPELRFDDFTQTDELVAQGYRNASEFLTARAAELEQRAGADRLGPLERLISSARNRGWYKAAEQAASDPGGAVLTAPPSSADAADADDDRPATVGTPTGDPAAEP